MTSSDLDRYTNNYYSAWLRTATGDSDAELELNDVRTAIKELGVLENVEKRFQAVVDKNITSN